MYKTTKCIPITLPHCTPAQPQSQSCTHSPFSNTPPHRHYALSTVHNTHNTYTVQNTNSNTKLKFQGPLKTGPV